MTAPSLTVDGLVRYFGGLKATDEVTLQVRPGELHAIIGPNGAGKTTLINLLTGELASDGGRILIGDVDVTGQPIQQRVQLGLLRSYQITSVFDSFTVRENICLAARRKRGVRMAVWKPLVRDSETMEVVRRIMAECQLQHVADEAAANLAYGQRRQLEIAMALAADPRLLLLDEPMAGMSAAEGAAAIELLRSLKGQYTIVLVEHDMNAVFSLADRISVLVYGKVIATGTADEIRNHPDVRKAYLGDDEDA
ncbi:ABC transporter ATP-binding protein [Pusillimonas noertemannii]|uniref:Branched-chain amino acid transport system ATP-binding protein n=1 Tax=Pusillimonas noertemannii TaxID=305977 RepID=A0A2U1CL93_9BURK|nr:ABC transporter ATP-binding protein [Pusillimonas noertemannii]NYT69294.1 ABC transporter ATP-binding protein [Pusillimonas noertemannii]PVY61761.1 branched-chain amino acid transport system ATP-binding protein [Pusillimonas noertemannii]TFL09697.1 ABC transporter ATP-binding protein [Pusillimonas noertemannii]